LISPRSSFHILGSAVNASFTLLSSTTKRDECLNMLNNGIINAPVLGIPMTLALYNDLSSPLFNKHKFDSEEFMEGVKYALDHYHSVEGQLQNQTLDSSMKELETYKAQQKDTDSTDDTSAIDIKDGTGLTMAQKQEWMQKVQEQVETLDINNSEWKKEAEDKPDSLVAQLMKMVAPTYFQHLYASYVASAPLLMLDPNPARYIKSQVSNVALLSARAEIIPPTPVSREEEEKLNEHDKQKNDDILNNIYSDIEDLPVAAQIEVLYDMDIERSLQNENDVEVNDDEKTIKGGVVQVAVFEAWLHNPDGTPLRWELASVRNPWEFR